MSAEFPPEVAGKVDVNRDGVIDVRDVEQFEMKHHLSGELSAKLRNAMSAQPAAAPAGKRKQSRWVPRPALAARSQGRAAGSPAEDAGAAKGPALGGQTGPGVRARLFVNRISAGVEFFHVRANVPLAVRGVGRRVCFDVVDGRGCARRSAG
jgi:hypothetical protein